MSHTVRFFHDFSSQFSYLATTQIEAVCARHDAKLLWHPMLLGGVFKALGGPVVPLDTFSPPKRRHISLDWRRWAEHYEVAFNFPTRFPIRTITPLRMVLALETDDMSSAVRLTHRIYKAYWSEDADISDRDTLIGLSNDIGLNGVELLERTQDSEVKQRLFENTNAAVEFGVFGAPSFLIDDTELFWGQDRFVLIEALLEK